MKIKIVIGFVLVPCFLIGVQCLINSQTFQEHSYNPQNGFVPDEETAIKIAVAVWTPIYGEVIEDEKPYIAELKDSSVWVVRGSLLKGYKGGVAYIEIQKSDCKILRVTHGK